MRETLEEESWFLNLQGLRPRDHSDDSALVQICSDDEEVRNASKSHNRIFMQMRSWLWCLGGASPYISLKHFQMKVSLVTETESERYWRSIPLISRVKSSELRASIACKSRGASRRVREPLDFPLSHPALCFINIFLQIPFRNKAQCMASMHICNAFSNLLWRRSLGH